MPSIPLENFRLIDTEYQRGVALDVYGQKIGIVSARQNDSGIWADWAFPQKRVDGENVASEKAIPVKILLGKSKDEAIQNLRFITERIKAIPEQQNNYDRQELPPNSMDGDIPF